MVLAHLAVSVLERCAKASFEAGAVSKTSANMAKQSTRHLLYPMPRSRWEVRVLFRSAVPGSPPGLGDQERIFGARHLGGRVKLI